MKPRFARIPSTVNRQPSTVSPPSGALGGVPAEPGRGVLPKTEGWLPTPARPSAGKKTPLPSVCCPKEPSPRCTSLAGGQLEALFSLPESLSVGALLEFRQRSTVNGQPSTVSPSSGALGGVPAEPGRGPS